MYVHSINFNHLQLPTTDEFYNIFISDVVYSDPGINSVDIV